MSQDCLARTGMIKHVRVKSLIISGTFNNMPSKVWDEITYPVPNFKSATIKV